MRDAMVIVALLRILLRLDGFVFVFVVVVVEDDCDIVDDDDELYRVCLKR
jgi:hypothetical protein